MALQVWTNLPQSTVRRRSAIVRWMSSGSSRNETGFIRTANLNRVTRKNYCPETPHATLLARFMTWEPQSLFFAGLKQMAVNIDKVSKWMDILSTSQDIVEKVLSDQPALDIMTEAAQEFTIDFVTAAATAAFGWILVLGATAMTLVAVGCWDACVHVREALRKAE
jgi:hypothetical protein